MTDEPAQPLAIDGGPPVRTAPWPHDPDPPVADDADAPAALVRELADALDAPAASLRVVDGVATARAAALRVATGEGREVALPDLCAGAWVESVAAAGLVPVPVEVDGESGALAARGLARALSDETRAVVVAHPFGHPASVTELRRVIGSRGVVVIEDATDALGAMERGRPVGTLGDVALARLGPAGDATAPALLARSAEPDTLAPAEDAQRRALGWLRAELAALDPRRHAAWELTFGLRGMRGAAGMAHARWIRHAYAAYVVRLRVLLWPRPLADTVAALRAEGIPCAPALDAPLYRDERVRALLRAGDPRLADDGHAVAERLVDELLAIPLAAAMTQHEVNDAVAALRRLEAAWR